MCTVVFMPEKDRLCFASLRDESPLRAKVSLAKIDTENPIEYIAPIDGLAGGTWLGANNLSTVIVLLNGGFNIHHRMASYKMSRGLIVKKLLSLTKPLGEWSEMNLENIEPFTLIMWSSGKLIQLVWDGLDKHSIEIDHSMPHIWSSSTLYDTEARSHRKALFDQWMSTHPNIDQQSVLDFFYTYANGENTFIMDRDNKVKTISYTFIDLSVGKHVTLHYNDLQNSTMAQQDLAVSKESVPYPIEISDL
jgi:hypothetical protein